MTEEERTSDRVFVLPWPAPELSPNVHVAWPGRARAVKTARLIAWALALEWKGEQDRWTPLVPPVTADITFVVTDRRRLDADNMLARLKPTWDGFVDAGLLDDDSAEKFRFGVIGFERGPKRQVLVRLRTGPGTKARGELRPEPAEGLVESEEMTFEA